MKTLLAAPSLIGRRLPTKSHLKFQHSPLEIGAFKLPFLAPLFEASKLPRLLHGAVPYEADQASRGLPTCSRWLYFYIPFGPRLKKLSEECSDSQTIDFVKGLTEIDVKSRFKASQALKNVWFKS